MNTSLPLALRNPAGWGPGAHSSHMLVDAPAVCGRPSLFGLAFLLLYCASWDHLLKKPLALKFLSHVYFWGNRTYNTSYPRVPHAHESHAPLSEPTCAARERPVHGALAPWYTGVLHIPVLGQVPSTQSYILGQASVAPAPDEALETLVKLNGTMGRMSWTPAGHGCDSEAAPVPSPGG